MNLEGIWTHVFDLQNSKFKNTYLKVSTLCQGKIQEVYYTNESLIKIFPNEYGCGMLEVTPDTDCIVLKFLADENEPKKTVTFPVFFTWLLKFF